MATNTTPSKARTTVVLGLSALALGLLIGLVIGNWLMGVLFGAVIMIQLTTRGRNRSR